MVINYIPNPLFKRILLGAIVLALMFISFQVIYFPERYTEFERGVLKNYRRIQIIYNNYIYEEDYLENKNFSSRSINTTCSEEVANLGYHQKIISYSFKNKNIGYSLGINKLIDSIFTSYPGWQIRIYATGKDISFLKIIMKESVSIYFCDVDHLPPPLNRIGEAPVTMWRFAPLGDPQVDIMMSRDTDSNILRRETDAVGEWLRSKKSLHIMRDHPDHLHRILGGMWGIKMTNLNRNLLLNLRNKMFDAAQGYNDTLIDQVYLKDLLWPPFEGDSITHDSYTCMNYSKSSPWPTRRNPEGNYVGGAVFRYSDKNTYSVPSKCPKECRPKNHLDWEYC